MTTENISALQALIQRYQADIPGIGEYGGQLEKLLRLEAGKQGVALISLYDQIYPLVERVLWSTENFDELLDLYQSLFREQEALVSAFDPDRNHDFILCIPIADRPEHLRGCLESILQLCHLYAYGGKSRGSFSKVSVIIVEDSKERANVESDIALAEAYTQQGLQVHHYGLQEQYELMLGVPADIRQA
ncbi:MAG: hypothetical protein ABFR19_01710, partial [Pseudomonadota bacterium]